MISNSIGVESTRILHIRHIHKLNICGVDIIRRSANSFLKLVAMNINLTDDDEQNETDSPTHNNRNFSRSILGSVFCLESLWTDEISNACELD
jgi:hypothetical protein